MAVAAIAGVIVLALVSRQERRRLRITRLRVLVPGLHPDLQGFTLAFITDTHVPLMYVPHETLLGALEELAPDLVALGGDYAGTRFQLQQAGEFVARVAERWPTVGVCGNTERYFSWDLDDLAARLADHGGVLLRNEAWSARHGAATVEVLGLDDPTYAIADADEALAQSAGDAHLRIALAHSPAVWQEIARLGAHMALCGHTHGGQVRIPGVEAIITHRDYPRQMASGLFRLGADGEAGFERLADHWQVLRADGPIAARADAGALMYVSRGLGVTPPRLRLFCPPEVVCVEFDTDAKEQDAER